MRKIALLLALICCGVNAQEIYKWTDASGKVHIGDRATAPAGIAKMDIRPQQSNSSAIDQSAAKPKSSPMPEPDRKSVPVDASRVGPTCLGLAEQIAKVEPGVPWRELGKEFGDNCPGIKYECVEYRSHPEKKTCGWIERTTSNFVSTKSYP